MKNYFYRFLSTISIFHLALVISAEALKYHASVSQLQNADLREESASNEEYPRPLTTFDLNQNAFSVSDRQIGRRKLWSEQQAPLFHGIGVHYAFLWVGSPPQRVSVIIDTGSRHTAFPCVGCKCGKHMDPYFDPRKSSTSSIPTCGRDLRCYFRQSYSEGSSWHAFKVVDKLWIGGKTLNSMPGADKLTVKFQFGCQDVETGLFRTQNIDGIMGMSANEDTLPYQLFKANVTKTMAFGLCMKSGGGIFSLGGIDTSIHRVGDEGVIKYAKLTKSTGWFTVKLLDIFMKPSNAREPESFIKVGDTGRVATSCNLNKGTIVDSGTTDTYLPASIKSAFTEAFRKLTGGIQYSNSVSPYSQAFFDKLPIIVYRLAGFEADTFIDIECHPSSYMERLPNNRYAFRIYLTEREGAVLGSNFMNNHNIIFDIQQHKIGFAKSDCEFQSLATRDEIASGNFNNLSISSATKMATPSRKPTRAVMFSQRAKANASSAVNGVDKLFIDRFNAIIEKSPLLVSPCSASCGSSQLQWEREIRDFLLKASLGKEGSVNQADINDLMKLKKSHGYLVSGKQRWKHDATTLDETCSIICDENGNLLRLTVQSSPLPATPIAAAAATASMISASCVDGQWSECAQDCTQYREYGRPVAAPPGGEAAASLAMCERVKETRQCFSHLCPDPAHARIQFDAKFYAPVKSSLAKAPFLWSWVQREDLIEGIAAVLNVKSSHVHVSDQLPRSTAASVRHFIPFGAAISVEVSIFPTDFEGLLNNRENIPNAVLSVVKRHVFQTALVAAINGNSTSSGVYKWLRASDIHLMNFRIIYSPKPSKRLDVAPKKLDLNSSMSTFLHEDELMAREKISLAFPLSILVFSFSILICYFRIMKAGEGNNINGDRSVPHPDVHLSDSFIDHESNKSGSGKRPRKQRKNQFRSPTSARS